LPHCVHGKITLNGIANISFCINTHSGKSPDAMRGITEMEPEPYINPEHEPGVIPEREPGIDPEHEPIPGTNEDEQADETEEDDDANEDPASVAPLRLKA
jgi:hypothetical protein